MASKKHSVVIADDDPHLLRLMVRTLQLEGFETFTATNGDEALDGVAAHLPDLVVLDVMMPVLDGFGVCERIREFSAVPIIMLTAQDGDQDKVRGLNLGADDYVTKPFNIDELMARVRAILRRSQSPLLGHVAATPAITRNGALTIDHAQHLATIDATPIDLTPIEFRLLAYLAQHPNRIVTQDLLIERIWGPGYSDARHMLHVSMSRLRRKIEPDPTTPRYIRTKTGIGYYFMQAEAEIAH